MKSKTLFLLTMLLLPLAVLAYVMVDFNLAAPVRSPLGQPLFSDLPVNRIAAIELTHADGSVSLKREDTLWVVVDRFGFPADFEKISSLVKRTAAMQIGNSFEMFPDTLAHLQLHDPIAAQVPSNQKGLRVVFRDASDRPLLDFILGRSRSAQLGGSGHYVRPLPGSAGYLVDGNFERVGRQPADWIEASILDVKPEAIWRVVCEDPLSGRVYYTLERPAPDRDPMWIQAQPADVLRPFRFDSVYRALINLGAEDVAGLVRDMERGAFKSDRRLTYYLYDGTVYSIYPGEALPGADDRFYLRVQSAYAPIEGTAQSRADDGVPDPVRLQEHAAAWNATIGSWVYVIPAWRHGSLVLDPAEFIERAN